ncbi:hypothetical protein J31TS6_61750 [Brevibacillus reuszeri]|uniref:hypothetical protein n=1 Tax=Brevibacillus reuszeri TaxID=54915 RepID=UPI001B068714|nr:hypothetical protein [Brevibacillus reuszeri]GIO10147.1 hypothetical protein J31TS6_61750 [Brevibacillus reuszeri]
MVHDEATIEHFKEQIKEQLGFKEVFFEKQVTEDLYYRTRDNNGIEDRIRIKPQIGTAFSWFQNAWRPIKGFKFGEFR